MKELIDKLTNQKDQAYSERNKVVAAIAHIIAATGMGNVYLAKHVDADWEDDWRNILVIELPNGQITWHFHDSEMHLLGNFELSNNYQYDGHSTEEKYKRLLDYCGVIKK